MGNYLFKMFAGSLLLTLALELPVGWAVGLRGKKYLILMILINLLTNPAAVLVCWLGAPQLPVEIIVITAEAALYGWFINEKRKLPLPVLVSLLCNGVSWAVGSWIGGFI